MLIHNGHASRVQCVVGLLALLAVLPQATRAQPVSNVLPAATQAALRVELREMARADQRVRFMVKAGTFSPCVADSLITAFSGMTVDAYIDAERTLRDTAAARTSDAERDLLNRMMHATDAANTARLAEIIRQHGWPSPERIGGTTKPLTFLLHMASTDLEALLPVLEREVYTQRMPPENYARAVDKMRVIQGEVQLYGTGASFDPETRQVLPPAIVSIEVTNAARLAIGLPELETYREIEH